MGIDERRLRVRWISASEGAEFAQEIREFDQILGELGENPLTMQRQWDSLPQPSPEINFSIGKPPLLTKEQIEYCMECSNCTGTCPVSRLNPGFVPKQIINRAAMGLEEDIIKSREVWACLGCAQCNTRCPSLIDIAEFNRSYRQRAREAGNMPVESHHGIQQAIWKHLMAEGDDTTGQERRGHSGKRANIFTLSAACPILISRSATLVSHPLTAPGVPSPS